MSNQGSGELVRIEAVGSCGKRICPEKANSSNNREFSTVRCPCRAPQRAEDPLYQGSARIRHL